MFKRPLLLLGLLLGALTAFCLRRLKPHPSSSALTDFRDFLTDALLVCDSTGTVVEANAPALALFGANHLPSLCYLTGQDVPPGQHPLTRAATSGDISGLYSCTAADGTRRVLDITARPLPDGKVAAVFREVTAQHESEERKRVAQARQAVVQKLCCRLGLAQTAEAVAQAAAEETLALLRGLPDVQVRLYVLDPASDTLTCLASAPDDRPKHPKSAAGARPRTVRFDVQVPELWQMYVARKPSGTGLPLIAGGAAVGHLSVTSSDVNLLDDPALREALELVVSLAALALAGPAASAQASAYAAQAAALREIVATTSSGRTPSEGADKVVECVKRVTHAEVCTLSVPVGGKLCVIGEAYKDDLLDPRTAPDAPRLHGKTVRKAWQTQKTVMHLGLPSGREAGPWHAFTGSAGIHSVTALPLASNGVLSVYTAGVAPLPDVQREFLETIAALLTLNPATATAPEDGIG